MIKKAIDYWDGPIVKLTLLILALGIFGFYAFMLTALFILAWNIREFHLNSNKLPIKLFCYRKNHMYFDGIYCSICGCHRDNEPDPEDLTKPYTYGD